jgi:hypothetical protein
VIAEVLDTLDGLFRLTVRSPTLDGSVPLRVARACVPLLEGNAYGLQVTLTRPLAVRRRLGRWQGTWPDGGAEIERRHAGSWPRLPVEGYLPRESAWIRALGGGLVRSTRKGLRIFTGLLLRPEPGTWLRLTSAANRRNTLFEVAEHLMADDGAFVPLVLDLAVRPGAPAAFRLEGELACLGPLRPGARFAAASPDDARDLARAHASFYDRAYFEEKREGVTGKYRDLVATEPVEESGDRGDATGATEAASEPTARCRVASIGSSRHTVVAFDRFITASGPVPERRPGGGRRLETVVFRNEVAFKTLFDGHTVALEYDRARLAARTQPVAAAFREALAGSPALDHPGSLLYLTKYFTPHPPGEPHFFVKPWALTATPPGWSSLLEGVHGDGYDVLRGVVSTDVFHATPAVFRIHREGAWVRVAEDAPLLRVIPLPRALLGREVRMLRLA